MKNKKAQLLLSQTTEKGRVSVSAEGKRLRLYFYSESQYRKKHNTSSISDSSYEFCSNPHKIMVNGKVQNYSEVCDDITRKSQFRDAKVLAVSTSDSLV